MHISQVLILFSLFVFISCLDEPNKEREPRYRGEPQAQGRANAQSPSEDYSKELSEIEIKYSQERGSDISDSDFISDSILAFGLLKPGWDRGTNLEERINKRLHFLSILEKWTARGKQSLFPKYILHLTHLGRSYIDAEMPGEAIRAFEKADSLVKVHTPNDYERISHINEAWGDMLTHLDQYEKSKEKYALNAKNKIIVHQKGIVKNRRHISWAIACEGWSYENLDEHKEAIKFVNRGIQYVMPYKNEWNRRDSIALAKCYDKLGEIYWKEGDYTRAMDNAQKAHMLYVNGKSNEVPSFQKNQKAFLDLFSEKKSVYQGAWTYSLFGDIYQSLGLLDSALLSKTIARTLFERVKSKRDMAIMNRFIGGIYAEKGEYTIALNYCKDARLTWGNLDSLLHNRHKGELAMAEASVHIGKKDYGKAINLLKDCLQLFSKIYDNKVHFSNIDVYNKLGESYLGLEEYQNAKQAYFQADSLYKIYVVQRKENPRPQVGALLQMSLAKIEVLLEDFKEARNHVTEAKTLLQKSYPQGNPQIANVYLVLSDIEAKTGNFDVALEYCNLAEEELPDHLGNSLAAVQISQSRAKIWSQKAKREKDYSLYQKAQMSYQETIVKLRNFQANLNHESAVQDWQENMITIFEQALNLQIEYNRLTGIEDFAQIFSTMEKYRAAVLRRSLFETKAKNIGGVPDSLLRKDSDLKRQQAVCHQMLYSTASGIRNKDSLISRVVTLQEEITALVDFFQSNYPRYYKAKYQEIPSSLETFQSYLKTNDASLLEYMVGDKHFFTLMITHDSSFISKKPLKELTVPLYQVFGYLNKKEGLDPIEFSRNSNQLFSQLIPYSILKKLTNPQNLIIIPDQQLTSLPFSVLVTQIDSNSNASFDDQKYLFEEFNLSYAQSTDILLHQSQSISNISNVLAIAPIFEGKDENLNPSLYPELSDTERLDKKAENKLRSQGKLVENIPEAKEVVSVVGGKALTGHHASKKEFLDQYNSYSILHFSTHSRTDTIAESLHNLQFVDVDSLSDLDELLFSEEIFQLDLDSTDMVVLSACESATGTFRRGEGLMSLARAFQKAGTPSVIGTLWQVDDASTRHLMKHFYKNLRKGMKKDLAISHAMQLYLKSYPNKPPFFWAPFISIGDQQSLNIRKENNYWIYVFWGLVLLVSIIVYSKSRKNQRFS